eukprot:3661334-Amphidinium_carterae.1
MGVFGAFIHHASRKEGEQGEFGLVNELFELCRRESTTFWARMQGSSFSRTKGTLTSMDSPEKFHNPRARMIELQKNVCCVATWTEFGILRGAGHVQHSSLMQTGLPCFLVFCPATKLELEPIITIVPLQLFSYYIAELWRGTKQMFGEPGSQFQKQHWDGFSMSEMPEVPYVAIAEPAGRVAQVVAAAECRKEA